MGVIRWFRSRRSKLNSATRLLAPKDTYDYVYRPSKKGFPLQVFFILGNEFCERFSYYGMKAVLILWLTKKLAYSDDKAMLIYHGWSFLCYFTPIFGALIADIWLGKFKTIFYISIIYVAGNVVLSLAAVTPFHLPDVEFTMIGLLLIALGTGGIKPCVAAFGGDQFKEGQDKQRQRFFSIFYISINAGSLISTWITPIFRSQINCFQDEGCYPLAFGVPAALMIVALILFLVGKPLYISKKPQGNVLVEVLGIIKHALGNKWSGSGSKRDHFLDYADDKYSKKKLSDVKVLLRVLKLYLPIPIFWSLFDQQGSKWTLQATRMDGAITDSYWIEPDQIQVVNPLFILLLVPLFEALIYPMAAKCNFLVKPLHRIIVGGFIAVAAFIVTGFVNMPIENNLPILPVEGTTDLHFVNTFPCTVNFKIANHSSLALQSFRDDMIQGVKISNRTVRLKIDVNRSDNPICNAPASHEFTVTTEPQVAYTIWPYLRDDGTLSYLQSNISRAKPEDGKSDIRIMYDFPRNVSGQVAMQSPSYDKLIYVNLTEQAQNSGRLKGITKYENVKPGMVSFHLVTNSTLGQSLREFKAKSGAAYTVVLTDSSTIKPMEMQPDVKANNVHLLWQLPQYFLITCAEVMFSITGYDFSYSQAPASMKSIIQASWLLTVAFGNLLVMVITELSLFEKDSYTFFFYAALMALDMLFFAWLASTYQYVDTSEDKSDDEDSPATLTGGANGDIVEKIDHKGSVRERNGHDNYAYEKDNQTSTF